MPLQDDLNKTAPDKPGAVQSPRPASLAERLDQGPPNEHMKAAVFVLQRTEPRGRVRVRSRRVAGLGFGLYPLPLSDNPRHAGRLLTGYVQAMARLRPLRAHTDPEEATLLPSFSDFGLSAPIRRALEFDDRSQARHW